MNSISILSAVSNLLFSYYDVILFSSLFFVFIFAVKNLALALFDLSILLTGLDKMKSLCWLSKKRNESSHG